MGIFLHPIDLQCQNFSKTTSPSNNTLFAALPATLQRTWNRSNFSKFDLAFQANSDESCNQRRQGDILSSTIYLLTAHQVSPAPFCTTRPDINHNFLNWQLATVGFCSGSFNQYALQHIAYPANSLGLTRTLKLLWPVQLCPHKTVPLPSHVNMKSEADDGRVVWDLLAGGEGKSMLVLFTFQANVFESSSLTCSSPCILCQRYTWPLSLPNPFPFFYQLLPHMLLHSSNRYFSATISNFGTQEDSCRPSLAPPDG